MNNIGDDDSENMPDEDDHLDDDWQILSNRHVHDGPKIGEGLSGVEKNKVTGKSLNRHTYFSKGDKKFPAVTNLSSMLQR